jgi:hypothetical protein
MKCFIQLFDALHSTVFFESEDQLESVSSLTQEVVLHLKIKDGYFLAFNCSIFDGIFSQQLWYTFVNVFIIFEELLYLFF